MHFHIRATEANNWAIYGIAESCGAAGHAITTGIEHPSVLEAMRRLEANGWDVTIIPPDQRGLITAESVSAALREDTRLVSVMMANNETGIIQPVAQIVSAVKAAAPSATFHTDATQAVGKISVSLCEFFDAVDLISLSSHKFHGPKGCGALVVRGGVNLPPLMVGGGQEGGRRSGTTNLPAIVGCGVAALEAKRHLANGSYLAAMRDRFEAALCDAFPNAVIFGRDERRLPNTSCFALPGQNANALADRLALRSRLRCRFCPGQAPPGVSMTIMGYHKRCRFRSLVSLGGPLSADLLVECLGDRTQPGSAQSFHLASSGPCQRRRQRQVDQQHHTCHRVKPSCADHVAVVGPPVQLQAGVDPFHCGTAVVQPLELLGRRGIGGNRRRSSSLLIRATTP